MVLKMERSWHPRRSKMTTSRIPSTYLLRGMVDRVMPWCSDWKHHAQEKGVRRQRVRHSNDRVCACACV
jgi:hypothetical protein